MCFSAQASFAVGSVLIPGGGYCVWAAFQKKPSNLALAVVPLFFGIQQISEGFVWLGMQNEDPGQTRVASLVFLFFALAFWPFWFPLFAMFAETQPWRKGVLALLSLLGIGWFWVFFFPLVVDPEILKTEMVHHSIRYDCTRLPIFDYVQIMPMRVLYFAFLAAPFLIGSQRGGWLPGLMLGLSALVSAVIFHYAFVSVWCFFAAVLTSYICYVFYHLPGPQPRMGQAPATVQTASVGER